ncbi:hypothetical protein Pogu_1195 [Pyrobaculum oguniense TE7]|uniref:Uncharacterized protein n=1 Tax=Pyrobaculum oguniense (strain DSM 13380 / JCM 10595 / TE7) TaxID=698757 RepID=H6Q8R7_PYROT|nr:hypothetical protein Pogu_1195 [Pyrobaculum oguniense TE7]
MFDAGGVWLVDISFMLAGAFGLTRSYGSGDIYKNMVRACAIADVGMELTLGVWCGWAGGQMGRRSLRGSPERRPFCLPVGWPFASAYFDR